MLIFIAITSGDQDTGINHAHAVNTRKANKCERHAHFQSIQHAFLEGKSNTYIYENDL